LENYMFSRFCFSGKFLTHYWRNFNQESPAYLRNFGINLVLFQSNSFVYSLKIGHKFICIDAFWYPSHITLKSAPKQL
jgi:hypothetical protein